MLAPPTRCVTQLYAAADGMISVLHIPSKCLLWTAVYMCLDVQELVVYAVSGIPDRSVQ
jgi:hypothetical protein